jgi:type IV secretion system protein TrbL
MNFNLLTTVLTTFVNALAGAQARVSASGSVLSGLAIIEIVMACLWMAMDGGSLSEPFRKLMQLSFWFWFATHFPALAKYFSDSLVQIALTAGGQSGNVGLLLDPSRIAGMALDATQPLVQSMHDAGMTHLGDIFMMGLCYAVLIGCFFVIACHVCVAIIEYYLVVTLASCLIPFGMSQHTKFLAEKAIGAAVAVSVKLMVLSFVIALIQPVFAQIHFSGTGEIQMNEALAMCLVCVLLAVIVWRAPGFAADLLAASPSLSAGTVGQHVTSAISTGATMIGGGIAASKMINAAKSGASPPGGARGGGAPQGGGARGSVQTIASRVAADARSDSSSQTPRSGYSASAAPKPPESPSNKQARV